MSTQHDATPDPAPARGGFVERVLMHFGGQCAVCRAWSQAQVCTPCLQRYARPAVRCRTCAARLPSERMQHDAPQCGRCLREPPPLERTIAALDYQFPWDGLLQHFKYQQGLELRETLLERLGQALDLAAAPAPDLVIAVPLSPERLRERGYNQAHELAKGLASRRGLRLAENLLLRVRHNPQQARLDRDQRALNVRGVFAVEPARIGELQARRVAVLDDVMTSGATLFEIARVLRRAGAREVQAWVVARTPEPGD